MSAAHMCCSEYKIIMHCLPQLNSIECACELKIKILKRFILSVQERQEHVIYFFWKIDVEVPIRVYR